LPNLRRSKGRVKMTTLQDHTDLDFEIATLMFGEVKRISTSSKVGDDTEVMAWFQKGETGPSRWYVRLIEPNREVSSWWSPSRKIEQTIMFLNFARIEYQIMAVLQFDKSGFSIDCMKMTTCTSLEELPALVCESVLKEVKRMQRDGY